MLDKRKVVIIGAGHVGSHVAMALCFQGTCDEIVFIDIDREKAVANCYDVADACLFLGSTTKIKVGDYEDCRDADIIVNSIGMPRKPGQTRLDMLDDSIRMMKDVVENLKPIDFKGIFVSITNPADVIANYARLHLGLPRERCFSTGTSLDTARLKRTVSELADIDRRSVTTCAIGEHGDSSFVPFSTLTLGGKNYKELQKAKPEKYGKLTEEFVLERTRYIGYDITVKALLNLVSVLLAQIFARQSSTMKKELYRLPFCFRANMELTVLPVVYLVLSAETELKILSNLSLMIKKKNRWRTLVL